MNNTHQAGYFDELSNPIASENWSLASDATSHVTGTTQGPDHSQAIPAVWGYIAVLVAAIFFGSNFVPVKKFETGDGLFFQWILCIGIWLSGFVLYGIRGFPKFEPLAMLGGFLWCTGNVAVVPIIKTVGLSQGMLIWAVVNLLSGWACDRFGWFGLKSALPASEVMNYVGVALCLISAIVYMFLKTNTAPQQSNQQPILSDTDAPLINDTTASIINTDSTDEHDKVFYENLPPTIRRLLGIVLAVIAGTLFGLNFTPVIYAQQNYPGVSKNGLDYVFAHFCGILATSSLFMAIYCVAMCNRPRVNPKVILPGLISGVMWAIADIGWFVANDTLSPIISFPIITSLPAIIGAMWGIFMFHEIKGRRNYIIFCSAVFLAVTGSLLTGLSKYDFSKRDDEQNSTTSAYWTTTSTSQQSHSTTENSTFL